MKKRLAIILHGGVGGGNFSQGQPGIQHLVLSLATKYTIELYSHQPPSQTYQPDGFNIFFAPRWIENGIVRWLYIVLKIFKRNIRSPYDCFYSFWGYPSGLVTVVLGKFFRKPTIIHLQGGDSVSIPEIHYGVFFSSWRSILCRWAYNRATVLIALTDYQEKCLLGHSIKRPIEIVPFGVDLQRFSFDERKFERDTLRFIHVANQTPVKDQKTMLEVFAYVAEVTPSHLTIIGDDFLDGKLYTLCVSLGIRDRIKFSGSHPHTSLHEYYANADILLHTSLYEGQGLVFAEAAASGVLIAGTCVGMLSDMGNACGLVVPVKASKLLAEKIVETVKLKQHYQIRKTARKWIEQRSIESMEDRIFQKIETIVM